MVGRMDSNIRAGSGYRMLRAVFESLFRPIMSGAGTQDAMLGMRRMRSQRKAAHSPLITSDASFADSILPLREW
jgi:hypothetical protein